MLKRIALALLACLFLPPVHAEPTGFRSYQLPRHGSLQLAVPRSWNDQMRQRQPDTPPTILFTPERGYAFNVQITPLWQMQPGAEMPDLEGIRRTVAKAAESMKAQAAETDVPLRELHGVAGSGYCFSVTDRAPKPDEFKYLTQGMLRVGDLVLAFALLSNDDSEEVVADTMKMLQAARHDASDKP